MKNVSKVLVFGGSGFLGNHVVDELISRGIMVTVFDLKKPFSNSKKVKFIKGNVLDSAAIIQAIKGHDVIYNFAGFADLNASHDKPLEALELNIMGNSNILEACVKNKIKRYIYASTVYVYSTKGSFYGVSKRCAEQIIEEFHRQFGLNFTILRYGSVYGTRADEQNRIYRIIKQALIEGKITFLGNGEEEREYIHVRDAANLSVEILDDRYKNQSLILTGVERFKYSELLNIIDEILNNKLKIEYLSRDYEGHYVLTPYSFRPTTAKKMVSNPYIDFGQGLLEAITEVYSDLKHKNIKTKFESFNFKK